jgi:hypothetical protein
MPQCCACDQEQLRSAFSKMQLRKSADKRKCGMCVAAILAIQCHPCDDSQPKETLDDKESLDEMPGESIMRWMDPPPFAACEHGTKGMTPLTIARCRKRCEDITGLVFLLYDPQSYSRPRSTAAFRTGHKGVDIYDCLRVMYANGALAVLGGDLQLARVVAAITCFAEIFLSTGASGAFGRSEIAFKNHMEILKLVMSTIETDDAMVKRFRATVLTMESSRSWSRTRLLVITALWATRPCNTGTASVDLLRIVPRRVKTKLGRNTRTSASR